MGDLLSEVRLLRAEVRQTTASSMRMQLLAVRLSSEQQRVTLFTQQLSELRSELAAVARLAEMSGANLKQSQESLEHGGFPQDVQQVMKAQLETQRSQVQRLEEQERQLQLREADLSAAASSAQVRWDDFARRLDDFERSLPAEGQR